MNSPSQFRPFLKWPGGKRWLVANHHSEFPRDFKRLIEPFLGSGCVFFALKPRQALLGDINEELITAYAGIKEYSIEVEEKLEAHSDNHHELHYYAVRNSRPRGVAARAARFIYLNRTCFNGIFRVNRQGVFNVPIGTRDTVVFDSDDFYRTSDLLKDAELHVCDFENLVDQAESGDFVFADPPYTVRHNLNGFIKYNETLFSWSDQIRLASALARAKRRGARIMCTNADHESVRGIYLPLGFQCRSVSRFSSISADGSRRRQFSELLITANTKQP